MRSRKIIMVEIMICRSIICDDCCRGTIFSSIREIDTSMRVYCSVTHNKFRETLV